MKIWWSALASALLIGTGVLAITSDPGSPETSDDEPMVMVGRERKDGSVEFAIEGKAVRGIYPGAVKPMRMTVVNPSKYGLRLQKLTGKVISSSRRGCLTTNLRVGAYDGKLPLYIEPHGRTTLSGTLPVTMPRDAPAKCAGVRFTIALAGVGFREGKR